MKKDFLIENGALLKYEGSSQDIVIPDEVTAINSFAIKSAKRVVLNSNCKKICKNAIGNVDELVIPQDSKLTVIEENAIAKTLKPVWLPDGIKVLNEGLPHIANLPRKLQTIKKYALFTFSKGPKNVIYYLPESLKKIEGGLNHSKNVFITKFSKPLEGWNIPDYEIDNVVFNVIDETIYEDGDFKYVVCEDDNGLYASIVSIPEKPFVIIPEKIGNYLVKVVCFEAKEIGNNKALPALYISKHVYQVSCIWADPILIGDSFNEKLVTNKEFVKLKESNNVYGGIKREDLKHNSDYYYVSKPNGITLLCYDGEETKEIYIPDEIDGEIVLDVAPEAFQFLQGKIDFIKYPESSRYPSFSKMLRDNHDKVLVNKHKVFDNPIFNYCNKSVEILDYVEKDGFKMLHIKDVDEEGYVIVELDYSVREKEIMNPPTSVNGLKVLGISCTLLKKNCMNSEMAKRYYSIYKKLY